MLTFSYKSFISKQSKTFFFFFTFLTRERRVFRASPILQFHSYLVLATSCLVFGNIPNQTPILSSIGIKRGKNLPFEIPLPYITWKRKKKK
jgi:hypothetical protein